MATDQLALRETMDAVLAASAEGRWRQDVWFENRDAYGKECGTAGCFAGWCAFLDGYTVIDWNTVMLFNPATHRTLLKNQVRYWAQERLGLDDNQATVLFAATNTLEDLKELVDMFCEPSRG